VSADHAGTRVPKILVIEDDPETSAQIAACLTDGGFEVETAYDGDIGLAKALGRRFEAITLDRMLPGRDGLAVVRALRDAEVDAPVLMISALGDVDERVSGLRAGGDDYLTKPFAPTELVARLEVLLRRHRRSAAPELVLQVADLVLDLVKHEARRGGRVIELLPTEYKLLEFMMRNAGQTLSRRMIFEGVWEYYFDPGTNLIEVHVGRLRKKIDTPGAEPLIKTERGLGYVFHAP
jgi:two-component system OmpR family response regulator